MPSKQDYDFARKRMREAINARPLTDFISLQTCKAGNRSFDGNMYACPAPQCDSGHRSGGDTAFMIYPNFRCICRSCHKFNENGKEGQDTLGALEIIWNCGEREALERAGFHAEDYFPGKATAAPITPASTAQAKKEAPEKETDHTADFMAWAKNIEQAPALEYLSYRGISPDTAQRFKLGFCQDWKHPKAQNAPPSPRLIIPTSRTSYLARDIRKEVPKEADQFKKQKVGKVHTFNAAALYAKDGRACFVTEGEIDALSIEEVGAHACAIGSTSRTGAFAEELKAKPTGNMILIALDNDEPGQAAAEELKKKLEGYKIPCAVVNVSGQHKDENEALTADRAGFAASVQNAERMNRPATRAIASFLKAVRSEGFKPMPTGLAPFDKMIGGGFVRQTLVMMGAAPGMGKSFFMQQILEQMAKFGHPVLYFNLEMSENQMLARSIARIAHQQTGAEITALNVLQGYKWNKQQQELIERTAADYADTIAPFIRYNPSGATAQLDAIIETVEREAEAAKNTGKDAPIICIDYLHLLRGRDREDGTATIKRAVDYFKTYAIKYNTVSILILAFNRDSNKGGKVTQESGRDSSAIEYSADVLLGLNFRAVEMNTDPDKAEEKREEARKEGERKGHILYRLKVLKNRLQGAIGETDLKFYGKYGLFLPARDEESGMECVDEPQIDRKWTL